MLIQTPFTNFSTFVIADDCSSNSAPNQPFNPHPISGSNGIPRNVTLIWDCSDPDDDILTYDIYFGEQLPIKKIRSNYKNNSYHPEELRYNTRYYWMIIASDPCGRIAISKLWTFITLPNTNPHPPTFSLNEPLMNTENVSIPVTLSITVFDKDDDALTVTFYDDSDNEIDTVEGNNAETLSTTWNDLNKNQQYSWYITITDDHYTITSDEYQFKTTNYNTAPVANIGSNYNGFINQEILFDASDSYDPDGIITEYRWDFNNDGIWDTSWLGTPLFSKSFSSIGTFTVALQVKDDGGKTQTDSTSVSITESDREEPVAQFIINPEEAHRNELITFDASDSYDPDGVIEFYRWDLTGEGSFSAWRSTDTITWTYSLDGEYLVALQVKDEDDLINTTTKTLFIGENNPPEKPNTPLGPSVGYLNAQLTFSSSSTDNDGDDIQYGWDWNNDDDVDKWTNFVAQGTTIQIQHSWNTQGIHSFKVKARDEYGLESSFSDIKSIEITHSNEISCPTVPSNPSPENNAKDVQLLAEYLQWNCTDEDDDKLEYCVYLNTELNFFEPIAENISKTIFYPGLLKKDTTYYWKVIVKDKSDDCEIESPVWRFTTTDNSQPSQPQEPSPANGQTNIDPCQPMLSWQCSDSDEDTLYYTVFFDDSNSPSTIIASGITNPTTETITLKYGTTYHWKVKVSDKKGEPVNSVEWSFSTKARPCKAVITGPKDTYSGKEVTFSASQSQCGEELINSYLWDFGDDNSATGQTVSYVYRGNDTFRVKLTISCNTDCLTCSDTTYHSIHVGNHPPKLPDLVHNDILPFIGGQIEGSYKLTVKANDPDGDKIRYRFDWGDNTSNTITEYVESGKEVTVSHTWMKEGTFKIKINAEDEGGDISSEISVDISIGSSMNIAMIGIVMVGMIIVSIQVIFIVFAHRKKMFQY